MTEERSERVSALDVECVVCGAAPTEPCRTIRAAESAPSGRNEYGSNRGNRREIKRPHGARVDAAREARSA